MSQLLRFPALSAPQVWVPRKTFLPALFSAGIVKDHFKRGSVAERQLPDLFFESPESEVVGDSARHSGAFEPVVHVNIGNMPVRIELVHLGRRRRRARACGNRKPCR
jgi:hypothetical protein